ncbi:MAG: hypothetical protein IPG90_05590 [Bacteroidetes bacterium]|nr:hypothetical protein [Bacteroidota bacterium]
MNEGDVIEENPDKAHLINATKLSGRTDKGLGVGILNAITGTTYAKIKRSNGEELRIATEPLSNYNIFVLDQNLDNNSEIFIANTSVLREGSEKDANVTTGQGTFENKKHNYRLTGRVSHSRINQSNADDAGNLSKQIISGNQYSMLMDKISGPSQYGGSYEVCEKRMIKMIVVFCKREIIRLQMPITHIICSIHSGNILNKLIFRFLCQDLGN